MLKTLFPVVRFFWGPVPTYPGGTWFYVFLSGGRQPLVVQESSPEGLKYYSPRVHEAAFVLPPYLKDSLGQ